MNFNAQHIFHVFVLSINHYLNDYKGHLRNLKEVGERKLIGTAVLSYNY